MISGWGDSYSGKLASSAFVSLRRRGMSRDEPSREKKSTQQELDQIVAVPPEIRAVIQAEIRDQLDRERAILRDAGSLALKIVGGAFALLLAIFTIFGLTTWKDIASQTVAYMKQRVDGLIQNSDSESGVKQTLNDLVNRSILAAELTSLSRQPGKPLDLPKFEWDRLKAWLKSESLEDQEFRDALALLNAQGSERKKSDANGFLSEMLNPPDASPYRWVVKQPEKRLAIMNDFMSVDLGASAVAIAQSSAVSEDLRLAAIKYIRDVNFTDAFDKIIAVASTADDGPLKTEALLTSAKLRPTNPRFLAELKKLTAQSNSSSMSAAINIVALLWEHGEPYPSIADAETEMQVMETSKKLLAFALDGGAYITIQPVGGGYLRRISENMVSVSRSSMTIVSIMVPTSQSSAVGAGSWKLQNFGELKPYWELLADAANNDSKKINAYMFSAGGDDASVSVAIGIGTNSSLVVKNTTGGDVTLKSDKVSEILLQPVGRGVRDLSVQWTKDHQVSRGKISNFSGGDFKFSLHVAANVLP
jgi:hypothetical protein